MRRRFVTLDVFTNRRFAGNPLAVVLDAERLDTGPCRPLRTSSITPRLCSSFHPAIPLIAPAFVSLRRAASCRLPAIRRSARRCCSACATAASWGARSCWRRGSARCVARSKRLRMMAVVPPSPFRNCRPRSNRYRTMRSSPWRWGLRRPTSASSARRAGRPGCPSHSSRSARGQGSSVAILISPDSTARSARVARPMCSAARPSSPATVFTPACSRPGWASRKIRPPAPRPRVCRLARSHLSDGTHPVTIEQGYEMGRPSLMRLVAVVEAGRVLSASIGGDAVVTEGTIEA
jgi:Predicted epimerase, PhzC/PhzF homolog